MKDRGPVPTWLRELGWAASAMDVPPPLVPPLNGGRRSAVLVLLAGGPASPELLIIRRSTGLRLHAGEFAFPGGEIEATDDGPIGAALREAAEEVALDPDEVEVVSPMSEIFIPPTGFRVTPVLAWWPRPRPVAPADATEVAAVDRISILEFAAPAGRLMLHQPPGIVLPAFRVREMLVWGMTAVVVDRLVSLGGWERSWDHRVVEAPPQLSGDGRLTC